MTPGEEGVITEWLAVFRTATDVQELDADTTAVKAIVGGSIVVSPVNCFDGLTVDDPGTTYVLGVVAPSKEQLDALVEQVGRPTVFIGRVRTMCLD